LNKNKNYYGRKVFGAGTFLFVLASQAAAETTEAGTPAALGAKTFFTQFVIAGGPIVWFILLPMSIVTVCLAIELCFTIRAGRLLPSCGGADISERLRRLGLSHLHNADEKDLVTKALINMADRYGVTEEAKTLRAAVSESLQQQASVLMRKVQWCNIIGNVAPMVGLFGTVFGMIRAFNLLGVAGGQPRPDQLAAAISIAALAMHGIFCSKIEDILNRAAFDAEGIIRQITASSSRPGSVQKSASPRPGHEIKDKLFKSAKDRLPIKPI
jgi:biopolymer transport protein ExbB